MCDCRRVFPLAGRLSQSVSVSSLTRPLQFFSVRRKVVLRNDCFFSFVGGTMQERVSFSSSRFFFL